jgi:hypothetical protein
VFLLDGARIGRIFSFVLVSGSIMITVLSARAVPEERTLTRESDGCEEQIEGD